MKLNCKKKIATQKTWLFNMLECVVAARQLWCWLQHWRYSNEMGALMKCVCKVSIYHPPKNQHTIMILHYCSLPWILRISPPQGSKNMNTLWWLLAYNRSDSYVRMVLEKCMWLYEPIAEHTPVFEHHFCDLQIAPVTRPLLIRACDFSNLIGWFFISIHIN